MPAGQDSCFHYGQFIINNKRLISIIWIMPASRWPPGAMARGGARQGPTTAIEILAIADIDNC